MDLPKVEWYDKLKYWRSKAKNSSPEELLRGLLNLKKRDYPLYLFVIERLAKQA